MKELSNRHGDWGCDADVGQAVSRFSKRLSKAASMQREIRRVERPSSNVYIRPFFFSLFACSTALVVGI